MSSPDVAPRYTVEVVTTRVSCEVSRVKARLFTPELAGVYIKNTLSRLEADQEHTGYVALDGRHRLLGHKMLTTGTDTQAPVSIRQMLRHLLAMDAHGFIFFHTHPSGDLEPSRDDLSLTKRIVKAGGLVAITCHDHIIMSPGTWKSLSLRGIRPTLFEGRVDQ